MPTCRMAARGLAAGALGLGGRLAPPGRVARLLWSEAGALAEVAAAQAWLQVLDIDGQHSRYVQPEKPFLVGLSDLLRIRSVGANACPVLCGGRVDASLVEVSLVIVLEVAERGGMPSRSGRIGRVQSCRGDYPAFVRGEQEADRVVNVLPNGDRVESGVEGPIEEEVPWNALVLDVAQACGGEGDVVRIGQQTACLAIGEPTRWFVLSSRSSAAARCSRCSRPASSRRLRPQ